MKLLFVLSVIYGGYLFMLQGTANVAVDSLGTLRDNYSAVATASEQWASGDTSVSFDTR